MDNKIADIAGENVYFLDSDAELFVKTATLCRITGKTKGWFTQLTNAGTLTRVNTKHGKMYNLVDAMGAYIEMLTQRTETKDEEAADAAKRKVVAEAALKEAKAAIAQNEAAELEGKMHRSEDVEAITNDLVFAIRNAIMAVPGKLSSEVIDISDQAEAADIIRKEMFSVLNELSEYKYDPSKYEERVRERLKLDPIDTDEE